MRGKEPDGRRLTKPTRAREREIFKITHRLPLRASRSQKARILFGIDSFIIFLLAVVTPKNTKYEYFK